MVARDAAGVRALRVAIAAIENAEAQPIDTLPELPVGAAASSEVSRRIVTDDEARTLVAAEIDDLLTSARLYESLGESDRSTELDHQVAVLRTVLD